MKTAARPATIFVGLSSFQALAMFRRGLFYTFLGVYLRSGLGLSVTETSLVETVPMLLNIAFQTFVWGRLTDRLQRRRSLIVAGELAASVGHVALWYAHSRCPDPRAAGYAVIWGLTAIEIFWSMSNIGWSAYISDVYGPERRGAVQGRLASVGGCGRILGALLGGALYDGMGRAAPGWGFAGGGIFFAAAAAMVLSVIPLLFIPEGGVGYRAPAGDGAAAPNAGAAAPAGRGSGGDLRVFAVFLVALLFINSGINSMATLKAQYLDLDGGLDASAAAISLVTNVESISLILVGLFMGALGRALGTRALLVAGAASGIACLLLYALAPGIGLVYLASVFKGVSEGCIAASSYAFASILIPPEKRGRYFAAYNATFSLSWGAAATLVTGPIIDGLLRSGWGEVPAYRAGILSSVGIMLLGLAVLGPLLAATRRSRPISAPPNAS